MPATPEARARTRAFARVIGPFLVIVPAIIAVRAPRTSMGRYLSAFFENAALVWVTGCMPLGGLLIIAHHQYWSSLAAILISLLGWFVALRGVTLLVAPQLFDRREEYDADRAVGLRRPRADRSLAHLRRLDCQVPRHFLKERRGTGHRRAKVVKPRASCGVYGQTNRQRPKMPRLQKQFERIGGPQVTAKLGTTTCTCCWSQTHSSGPQTQAAFTGWTTSKSPATRTEPAKTVLITVFPLSSSNGDLFSPEICPESTGGRCTGEVHIHAPWGCSDGPSSRHRRSAAKRQSRL